TKARIDRRGFCCLSCSSALLAALVRSAVESLRSPTLATRSPPATPPNCLLLEISPAAKDSPTITRNTIAEMTPSLELRMERKSLSMERSIASAGFVAGRQLPAVRAALGANRALRNRVGAGFVEEWRVGGAWCPTARLPDVWRKITSFSRL